LNLRYPGWWSILLEERSWVERSMLSDSTQARDIMIEQKKWMTITGWIIAGLLGAMIFMGAVYGFKRPPEMMEQFTGRYGYPESTITPILIAEVGSMLLFLIPQTSILGAILMTGYLGGATATHVRVHEAFFVPIVVGVMVWVSLYLRDPRIRALMPLRSAVQ
jgi:hypothetical protein